MWWSYKPYVSVGQRQANAKKEMEKLRKKGKAISPVEIAGMKIAKTFWGKAWCDHIECLSDFKSRLDRGKRYVRNGSVCHLEIKKGRVEAKVSGSELYDIAVDIDPLDATTWTAIKRQCGGRIGTMVELLQGKFSNEVMKVLTNAKAGMFPHADDFRLDCSCPDFARLCKHLAAVLYGVGARLDEQPELLFTLRGVDHLELIEEAATGSATIETGRIGAPAMAESELADVFGIDLAAPKAPTPVVISPTKPGKSAKPGKQSRAAIAPAVNGQPLTGSKTPRTTISAKIKSKPARRVQSSKSGSSSRSR